MLLADLLNDFIGPCRETFHGGYMFDLKNPMDRVKATDAIQLCRNVLDCERFVLTADALDLAAGIADKLGQVEEFISITKPPSRKMWIEWLAPKIEKLAPDKLQPDRCGVLIEPDPDGSGLMMLRSAFSIRSAADKAAVEVPPISLIFDTNATPKTMSTLGTMLKDLAGSENEMAGMRRLFPQVAAIVEEEGLPAITAKIEQLENTQYGDAAIEKLLVKVGRHKLSEREDRNLRSFAKRLQLGFSPLMGAFALANRGSPPKNLADQFAIYAEEEAREMMLGLAALTLIRGEAFEFRNADLGRLNKSRLARGRLPLLSHVVADTPNRWRLQLKALGYADHEIREHARRGHFRRLPNNDGTLGPRVTWVRPAIVAKHMAHLPAAHRVRNHIVEGDQ